MHCDSSPTAHTLQPSGPHEDGSNVGAPVDRHLLTTARRRSAAIATSLVEQDSPEVNRPLTATPRSIENADALHRAVERIRPADACC